jgi:hypothetical protein
MWETSNAKKCTSPTLENLQQLSRITGAPVEWLLDDSADISKDWKAPAEVIAFPASSSLAPSIAAQCAAIIDRLSKDDQLQFLHYLRIHAQSKGLTV